MGRISDCLILGEELAQQMAGSSAAELSLATDHAFRLLGFDAEDYRTVADALALRALDLDLGSREVS